jgi:hypothetical protein
MNVDAGRRPEHEWRALWSCTQATEHVRRWHAGHEYLAAAPHILHGPRESAWSDDDDDDDAEATTPKGMGVASRSDTGAKSALDVSVGGGSIAMSSADGATGPRGVRSVGVFLAACWTDTASRGESSRSRFRTTSSGPDSTVVAGAWAPIGSSPMRPAQSWGTVSDMLSRQLGSVRYSLFLRWVFRVEGD